MGAPLTVEKILARRVDMSAGAVACWPWTGYVDRHGYGEYSKQRAHRLVYEALVGPIPAGLELDHLCRNPICVNPSHLEPVTHAENMHRAFRVISHCPAGHAYDEANTRLNGNKRICRTCHRERERERARRSKVVR